MLHHRVARLNGRRSFTIVGHVTKSSVYKCFPGGNWRFPLARRSRGSQSRRERHGDGREARSATAAAPIRHASSAVPRNGHPRSTFERGDRGDQGGNAGRDSVVHIRPLVLPREIVWRRRVRNMVRAWQRRTEPHGRKCPKREPVRLRNMGQRAVGPVQDRKPSIAARAMHHAVRGGHDPRARLRRYFRSFLVSLIHSSRNARYGTEP
ncbi:hypothetical protein BLA39750_02387 [Burkholderia lata]|uniref:Uncharacterized protein n=1 Tax=Burkholderia lata (strain ATCC 17760 / DSM 23089 / LMG 22485 / NCIMB 9086 / R18194 / 383) TaxID=482957 RepID=A0A6P2WLZ0_BURL3|nr:hypothetical protein BLA39750_02387 [Burkholderia lata]